jgi:hypothetical protein
LVINDPEEFVRRVREAVATGQELTPHPSPSADGLVKTPEWDTLSPRQSV